MKVLILSRHSESRGGVVNYTNLLIRTLSDRVHFDRLIIGKRIRTVKPLFQFFVPLLDCARLLIKISRGYYSLVHLNPSLGIKSILRDGLFLIALRVFGWKNTIVFWHGWEETSAQSIKKNHFFSWLFRNVFDGATVTLVLASCFRETLTSMGFDPSRIRVATTMFDGDIFEHSGGTNSSGCNRILFLSRLIKQKGIYELLKAFESVASTFPEVHLIIAGDGPERLQMEKWLVEHNLSDKVTFTGYVRGKDKGKVLLNTGLFVFPSSYGEGCPVALLEAMGAGLAVVTTPAGGIPDIVEDGINAIILNESTLDKIAEAIYRFLDDDELCKRVQQNNRRKAWANYEAKIVATKIEEIYKEVAARG